MTTKRPIRVVGVRIEGFRGIRDVTIPLERVTALIGRNGAGKTSILEALGFITSEEGAEERLSVPDAPDRVSWFIGWAPAALHALTAALFVRPLPDLPDIVSDYIVVIGQDTSDGFRVTGLAFNAFAAIVDHLPDERTARHSAITAALADIDEEWSRHLRAELDEQLAAGRYFISLRTAVQATDTVERPSITSMIASPDDISPMLFHRCVSLATAVLANSDDSVAAAVGELRRGVVAPLHDRGLIEPLLRLVNERLDEITPKFITRRTRKVRVELRPGPDGASGEAHADAARALALLTAGSDATVLLERVCQRFEDVGETIDYHFDCVVTDQEDQSSHHFSRLGTGTRRWVTATLDEAFRQLISAYATHSIVVDTADDIDSSTTTPIPSPGLALRLADEPLESLEPRVHRQVVEWLHQRLDESEGAETILLTTHQPSVLRAARASNDLAVVGIRRRRGETLARPLGPGLLKDLRDSFASFGLSPEDILLGARALLMVEGADDYQVLMAIYRDQLESRGVLVHQRGGTGARQIIAAFTNTAYEHLEIPAFALVDQLRDPRLHGDDRTLHAKRELPNDLRVAIEQVGNRQTSFHETIPPLTAIGFDPTDICFGFDAEVYAAAFAGRWETAGAAGWYGSLVRTARTSSEAKSELITKLLPKQRPNTKTLSFSSDLLPPLLEVTRGLQQPEQAASVWLESSMASLFEAVDAYDSAEPTHQDSGSRKVRG